MISTARRVEYAQGYLALGLLAEAAGELDAVCAADRAAPSVMSACLSLHMATGRWDTVARFARTLIELDRDDVGAWISLGCALRRIESVAAARALLLEIEPTLGQENAVIHYNLACYHCLLGDLDRARRSLATACAREAGYRRAALADPDLERLWPEIASSP